MTVKVNKILKLSIGIRYMYLNPIKLGIYLVTFLGGHSSHQLFLTQSEAADNGMNGLPKQQLGTLVIFWNLCIIYEF